MPNGKVLPDNATTSTSQAAIIVPMPGKSGQYCVFSLTSMINCQLYYNIIDMSLDNGLGDVVPGTKTQLSGNFSEEMIAVSGNNCNTWLLTLSGSAAELKAYNIGFNGIDTSPVITPKTLGSGVYVGYIGTMAISPDQSKVAIAQGNFVMYDFDGSTGRISNEIILDKRSDYYGVVFSADNTKLYGRTQEPVHQFDLTTGNPDDMVRSKTLVFTCPIQGMLQRGPDDKIYVVNDGGGIGIIHKPNFSGLSCNYERGGLSLLPGTDMGIGLPSFATIVINDKFYSNSFDTVSCADSLLLTAKNITGTNYKWNDGTSGASRQVYSSGTYWLSYQVVNDKCDEYIDTFHVTIYNIPKHYTTTTFTGKCKADTFMMTASNLLQSHYLWEDSITVSKTRKVNKSGRYWISYRSDSLCEHYVDSFIVNYPEKDGQVSFDADTLVCENDVLLLKNTSDTAFNSFTWQLGNQDSSLLKSPEYSYTKAGTYTVMLVGKIDGICLDTAYKSIAVDALLPVAFLKTPDSICTGSSINFYQGLDVPTIHNLQWDFGDGAELVSQDNKIQHAYTLAGKMPISLNATFRACPASTYTDTVYIYALPSIDLGPDQSLCPEASPIYLKNLLPEGLERVHYLWNTGDTTAGIRVKHTGTYSLQVRSGPLACSNSEWVIVHKDCYMDIPNAFTPNGDGLNDYFFPRSFLSGNVTSFKMQVFNRWGQIIFEARSTEGRGWNGQFNGEEQLEGVYAYIIDAEIEGGRYEHYHGNVTLMR